MAEAQQTDSRLVYGLLAIFGVIGIGAVIYLLTSKEAEGEGAGAGVGAGAPEKLGHLTVVVVDAGTNQAIRGAVVSIDGYSATTDSSGKVKFDVKPGTYTVKVSATGYKPATKSIEIKADQYLEGRFGLVRESAPPPPPSPPGELVTDIVLRCIWKGQSTLEISTGDPLEGMSIEVYEYGTNKLLGSGFTDLYGDFKFRYKFSSKDEIKMITVKTYESVFETKMSALLAPTSQTFQIRYQAHPLLLTMEFKEENIMKFSIEVSEFYFDDYYSVCKALSDFKYGSVWDIDWTKGFCTSVVRVYEGANTPITPGKLFKYLPDTLCLMGKFVNTFGLDESAVVWRLGNYSGIRKNPKIEEYLLRFSGHPQWQKILGYTARNEQIHLWYSEKLFIPYKLVNNNPTLTFAVELAPVNIRSMWCVCRHTRVRMGYSSQLQLMSIAIGKNAVVVKKIPSSLIYAKGSGLTGSCQSGTSIERTEDGIQHMIAFNCKYKWGGTVTIPIGGHPVEIPWEDCYWYTGEWKPVDLTNIPHNESLRLKEIYAGERNYKIYGLFGVPLYQEPFNHLLIRDGMLIPPV